MERSERLVALDVFRGITITGMIIVNTLGSWEFIYTPFTHSEWHGATPTDYVFPFFLFIVGVAMWFSFKKYGRELNAESIKKIIRRTIVIFIVGLFLVSFPRFDLENLRILGVLQRIALAYGIGAILCLWLDNRKLVYTALILLFGYWLTLWAFGGQDPYSLEDNVVRKIDLWLLGANHVYNGFGISFEPEGLLSTLPSVVTVIIGFLTGRMIQVTEEKERKVLYLFLWGVGLMVAGIIWHPVFPINKPLWTSSYVVYIGGISMIFLAFCIWFIDVKNYRKWSKFFQVFGMNPLFAYVLSILLARTLWSITMGDTPLYTWIYTYGFVPFAGKVNGSLLFAITAMLICWLICLILYRRRIYVKI